MPKKTRSKRRKRPRNQLPPFLRRRSTRWLYAAIITLAIGVGVGVIGSQTGGDDDGANGAAPPTVDAVLSALDVPEAGLQPADIVRIIDGDTIEVRLADGSVETVRYYGIDTPERGDDCFDEAADRNEALAGDEVLLLPDARERDPFDRLLRYVFDADGESIDTRLIAEGLATAWREDGRYRDELVAVEEDARQAEAGCLWG